VKLWESAIHYCAPVCVGERECEGWGACVTEGCQPVARRRGAKGNLEAVRLLVEHGADVNAVWQGKTGLTEAIRNERTDIVEFLRSHGAKTPEEMGWRPGVEDEALLRHLTQHFGVPRPLVIRPMHSPEGQIAVHVIDPPEGGSRILVTEGMSSSPMTVPPGAEDYRFAELLMRVGVGWPVSESALSDPATSWPVDWLQRVGYHPHEQGTWLGGSFAFIDNEDPPEPLGPDVEFTCLMLIEGLLPHGRWTRSDGTVGVL
jgi:hypothetical protein